MRHIPFNDNPPDPAWLVEADKLLAQLKAAPDTAARKEIIDANVIFWGKLKNWLLELSHEKCWFSESKDCFSHWDVEHFRPKKSAKDIDGTEHEGYWWLAFDWHNYRICGNAGNRKKGTYFPLRTDSPRATGPTFDLRLEAPLLLDPIDDDDPNLISFNVVGRAIPAPGLTNAWDKERVTYSVERFNLDFPPLMEKRKVIWNECWQRIQSYKKELQHLEGNDNPIARTQARELAKYIREMMRPEKELSSVARACVLSTGDPRLVGLLRSA